MKRHWNSIENIDNDLKSTSFHFLHSIITRLLFTMIKERAKKFGVKRWAVTFIIYRKLRHSIDSCLVYKRVTRFVLFESEENHL